MKKLLVVFFVVAGPLAAAEPEVGAQFTDADMREAFVWGLTMQLGFEATGLMIRLIRNFRASGSTDLSG